MYVPTARYEEAVLIAAKAGAALKVGNPDSADTDLGPVASILRSSKGPSRYITNWRDGLNSHPSAAGSTLVAGISRTFPNHTSWQ